MTTYPNGSLLKAQVEVDLVQNGQRRWIPDPETFNCMGLDWRAIKQIPVADWDAIPAGPAFPSRRDGTVLIRSDYKAYLMQVCQRRWIPDPPTLEMFGGWQAGKTVQDADLKAIPEGAPITSVVIGLSYIRDTLDINDAFLKTMKKDLLDKKISPGSTILFAARVINVDTSIILANSSPPPYNLVFFTDSFNQRVGVIDVSGASGANGSPGQPGTHGRQNGGPGSAGQAGSDGQYGANVTIYARTILSASVLAMGGSGGLGGNGGHGGDGAPGDKKGPGEGTPGGNGGDGGDAGNGGNGGNSGQIAIYYVNDSPSLPPISLNLHCAGGAGGSAGQPGIPGKGGFQADNGQYGAKANIGAQGVTTGSITQQLDLRTFYTSLHAAFPAGASAWANYRVDVGLYNFRMFRPNNPDFVNYVDAALLEFDAVLFMQSDNAQATQYREWLLNNQNVFGLARDFDLVPTFDRYNSVISSYMPSVFGLFEFANNILVSNLTLDAILNQLNAQVASLKDLISQVTFEQTEAQTEMLQASAETDRADVRYKDIQTQIQDLSQQEKNEQIVMGVLVVAVAVIATAILVIATDGIAFPAATPLIEIAGSSGIDVGVTVSLLKNTGTLATLLKAAGDIGDLISGAQKVFSVYKMIEQLQSGKGDPRMIDLLKQELEIVYAQLLAKLHVQQAQNGIDAVNAKMLRAQNDLQREQSEVTSLSTEPSFLEQLARGLARSAQGYLDTLIKYSFYATRAVEIYALVDLSSQTRYDYGYIHPDLEQELPAAQLMGAYSISWSQFLGISNLKLLYDDYFLSGTVSSDILALSFADPVVIANFKKNHDLLFFVNPSELPSNRYEAKVVSIYLSLNGAQATAPLVSCVIEHSGRYTQKKRDGTLANLVLKPRSAVVPAGLSSTQVGGVISGPEQVPFWGRGVATSWHLYIEPDVIKLANVDLSNLTSITLEIGYDAFLV